MGTGTSPASVLHPARTRVVQGSLQSCAENNLRDQAPVTQSPLFWQGRMFYCGLWSSPPEFPPCALWMKQWMSRCKKGTGISSISPCSKPVEMQRRKYFSGGSPSFMATLTGAPLPGHAGVCRHSRIAELTCTLLG